jgi:NitT/TauT family transport system substrate-binding protein
MPVEDLGPLWDEFVFQVALDERTLDVLNAHASWRLATGNHPPGAVMPDWRTVIFTGPLKSVAPEKVTLPF